MARFVAIDWDSTEARYVVADARGERLSIESVGAVPLPEEKDTVGSRAQLGEALKEALSGKTGRATTLLSIDRGQVEVVSQTLPPAADIDLPEMVRNQAMRDNNAIAEDSLLDFVPLNDAPDQPRKVTAISLSQPRWEQIQAVLTGASLTAQEVTLRPYATAELVLAGLSDPAETCLVIHVLAEEVDLIILSGGKAVFWRTLRLSNASCDEPAARRLLSEFQRTLVVAQPQMPGQTVKAIYLCGGLEEHSTLAKVVADESQLPMTIVDPFATSDSSAETIETPGRFAPLVGMITTASRGKSPAIDFLNPRRRPAPPDRRRTYILAGAVAAVVLLFGGYHVWSQFSAADEKIADLDNELERLKDQLKQAGQRQKVITAIENWTKNDVNWLDELRDLSLRFPGGRDAVVLRMGLSQGRDAGGSIDLVGIVRDPVVVSHIENSLRDDHHQISSRHMQEQLQQDNYTWHFESSIGVTPRKSEEYLSHLSESEQAALTKPSVRGSATAKPSTTKTASGKASP